MLPVSEKLMYANTQNIVLAGVGQPTMSDILTGETQKYSGFFNEPLAGRALIRDNDNFTMALVNEMPTSEVTALIRDMKVPQSAHFEYQKALVAMAISEIANNVNISLRQELVRVSLSDALVKATTELEPAKLAGDARLGFIIEMALVKFFHDSGAKSLPDYFSKLGKSIGSSLQSFGKSILSFRDLIIQKWGEFGRYFADFVILTPGGKFIFGNLALEVGVALETGKFTWENIAAAGSQYLKDMAMVLKVVGIVAPPPWNLIAKIVAVIYEVGYRMINWQLAMHLESLMERQAEANERARAIFEQELADFAGHLYTSMPPSQSEFGSNSTLNPKGGGGATGIILIGAGAVALLAFFGG